MADTTYNISDASLDDGTINFYTLVNEPFDADEDALRAKIQGIYTDAQANRDHRNLNKRREYQTLLEWLPQARSILLEPEKRARYDTYLSSVQNGTSDGDFGAFVTNLLGQSETMDDRTSVLGVQDRPQESRSSASVAASEGSSRRASSTPASNASVSTSSRRSSPSAPAGTPPAITGAITALIVGALAGWFVTSGSVYLTLVIALVLAVVVYMALSRKPRGRIRS